MIINEDKNSVKLVEDANHQLIYNPKEYRNLTVYQKRMIISDQIGANGQGEEDAIRGYYRLITMLEPMIDEDPVNSQRYTDAMDKIKEIISDEKHHQLDLINIRNWTDGKIPTNPN